MQSDFLLIAAPTKAGVAFMKHTKLVGIPFVALTNNKMERIKLKGLGAKRIIQVDTTDSGASIKEVCPCTTM
ncbi:hypothetical protein [Paenibacillus sp. Soil750]|uniref:hypothetical protein n=1 Tax=Paenibacillus sp. Soil750 TaxID=1736398 RepID=UPI0006F83627|nr:hypothetical protein [Paenibacillus sp. Soil750]KRE75510.1 hypothetical protein ASL11_01355 [Paenibacillus sp. Soil750]